MYCFPALLDVCSTWNPRIKKILKYCKNSENPMKHHRNFCLAVDNTGVISVCYHPPLCFVLVSLYCLCVRFVLLQSHLINDDRKVPNYHLFLTCKCFHMLGCIRGSSPKIKLENAALESSINLLRNCKGKNSGERTAKWGTAALIFIYMSFLMPSFHVKYCQTISKWWHYNG